MLADMAVGKLVENEQAATDDGGILKQGRPLTAPAPFIDGDAASGGKRFVFPPCTSRHSVCRNTLGAPRRTESSFVVATP
eukprot:14687255-Alexandrium_andersonii.AAC.1